MKSHKPQLYIWNDSTVRNCTAPFDMTAHPSLRAGRTCTGHDSKSCSLQRNMYVCHHVTYLPVWSIYTILKLYILKLSFYIIVNDKSIYFYWLCISLIIYIYMHACMYNKCMSHVPLSEVRPCDIHAFLRKPGTPGTPLDPSSPSSGQVGNW
jgi:hypothetical protein